MNGSQFPPAFLLNSWGTVGQICFYCEPSKHLKVSSCPSFLSFDEIVKLWCLFFFFRRPVFPARLLLFSRPSSVFPLPWNPQAGTGCHVLRRTWLAWMASQLCGALCALLPCPTPSPLGLRCGHSALGPSPISLFMNSFNILSGTHPFQAPFCFWTSHF